MPPSSLSRTVAEELRVAYDGSAAARNVGGRASWQLQERELFLARVLREQGHSLVEVGAGAGHDSEYFARNGLAVVATDLSPQMVEMCRRRGLQAHVMDMLCLDLRPDSFDAVYAMNSLLHVPNADLAEALAAIRKLLKPSGLFYLGVYGGLEPFEGTLPADWHVPPRFFSFRTDSQLLAAVSPLFNVEEFRIVEDDRYFQALTLRALP